MTGYELHQFRATSPRTLAHDGVINLELSKLTDSERRDYYFLLRHSNKAVEKVVKVLNQHADVLDFISPEGTGIYVFIKHYCELHDTFDFPSACQQCWVSHKNEAFALCEEERQIYNDLQDMLLDFDESMSIAIQTTLEHARARKNNMLTGKAYTDFRLEQIQKLYFDLSDNSIACYLNLNQNIPDITCYW
jgi:hypothetical protein